MPIAIAMRPSEGSKIQGYHRDRLAVVYVRQSTVQQRERHQESTRLQYGLVERALTLGWARQRILVIDEDLGRSGATAEGRPGFQRLVAEVGLDHVGMVLGIEMSRLARSCRDWHQLLEVCALFGTLIGDLDGVYDPTVYNDRLLLGLKGTMSEAELHVLKQRMLEGKRAKARRGELGMKLPMGYWRPPSGEVIKDPDEQAQTVIELVFNQFERLGTLHGVLRYLVAHEIQMPYRVPAGPRTGELEWRRPNRVTLGNLLHNPIYAGAYAYGRRPIDSRRKKPGRPGTGRTVVSHPDRWDVLLKDRLPAYISWDRYEGNLKQLAANTPKALGVIRKGTSLLTGLLICGRCGARMLAQYRDNGHQLRYSCHTRMANYAEDVCQSLAGSPVDEHITALVLQALEPAALELSLKVAEDLETERRQLRAHWEQRLERAHYEVERAFRQYNAVEPENRLVARTLERHWEEALAAEAHLQAEYARCLAQQPATLSAEEREAIRQLACDIPALWRASSTTAAERQAIIRHLIDRIIVTVQGVSEKVDLQIQWAGGHQTQTLLIRPVARLEQLSYYPELVARVLALRGQGHDTATIAHRLNTEGWRPTHRAQAFNASIVRDVLARQGVRSTRQSPSTGIERQDHEWTLYELAQALTMPQTTLYGWLRKGWLKARCDTHGSHPVWLVHADPTELARLQALRGAPGQWPQR